MDINKAKESLQAAIDRHRRHMSGTEPTSEASQRQMMSEMMQAMEYLSGMAQMSVLGPGRFR